LNSLEKIDELLKTKTQSEIAWKTHATIGSIKSSLNVCESIFDRANKSNLFKPEAMEDFNSRKEKVFSSLLSELRKHENKASADQ
jgi:hypothetical protein